MYVKRVETDGEEVKIAQFLNEEAVRDDPQNHSIPILDVFEDDEDKKISYLVMPFLRLMDDPPFSHINDVVEFVDQVLEVRDTFSYLDVLLSYAGIGVHA